jgi:hypothetical protein
MPSERLMANGSSYPDSVEVAGLRLIPVSKGIHS